MKLCADCHLAAPGQDSHCPGCGADLEASPDLGGHELGGLVIDGKVRLEECVGEGAMGWVYRGTHLRLQSTVAVKLMKPVADDDGTRVARFEQEARAASRLHHPHILMIHDFGRTPGGLLYIVSEFLKGKTLSQVLERPEDVPLGRAVNVFNQVLAAVEEAHSQRVIHRDLKPENIVLMHLRSGEDFAKVLDFGIARVGEPGDSRITLQGELCGTPAYMAPEQIRGAEANQRTDLYSLSLILYELLTGRAPFHSDSVMEMLALQLHSQPAPIREAAPERDLPEALEAVVSRGLSKDPQERYATIPELRDAVFLSLREVDEAKTPCHACHLHRPAWSNRCVSCGLSAHTAIGGAEYVPLGRPSAERQTQSTLDDVPPPREPALSRAQTLYASRPEEMEPGGGEPRPFVGRELELQQVDAFFAEDRRLLEILAPLGTGKSTLLDAVAARAAARGYTVLRAGADPRLNREPWYPVRALVAARLGLEPIGVDLATLRRAGIEAGLGSEDVAGLADLFGLVRDTTPPRPSVRMRETRAAALSALLATDDSAPGLCLILDDADEYDGASLAFLQRLYDRAASLRTRAVLAGERSVLPADGPQVTLYLGPFDADQVQALVTSSLPGGAVSEQLVRSVLDTSGGNPLLASETLRLVAEGQAPVAGDLAALVASRLERLSESAREALALACLIGNEASVALLQGSLSAGQPVGPLIEELVRHGFLQPPARGAVAVSHPQIAQRVRDTLTPQHRAALHGRIHDALKRQGAGFLARARHAFQAGLGDVSLTLLEQAGDLSRQWLDEEGAAVYFRDALHVARWELLVAPDDERFLSLSLKLADALGAAGHFLSAEMVLKEALASSRRHPALRIRLHLGLTRLFARRELTDKAAELAREAVGLALELGDSSVLLESYLELATLLERQGAQDAAVAELDEVLFLLSVDGDAAPGARATGLWRLVLRLAELRERLGESERASQLAAQALELARAEQSLEGQGACHLALARLLLTEAHSEEADASLTAAVAAFRRLGDRRSVAECLLHRARIQPQHRETLATEAQHLARQVQWSRGLAEAQRLLTEAA